ncbi:uncharacterized protein [Mytilus edulis]|uniref:uncharacterized protein isoform X2 n=1 Tax=Mytilus edulis TaxID=6550 RepID=UPI0039EF373E
MDIHHVEVAMNLLVRILSCITMVLTAPVLKYDVTKRCSNIQCENDSHCMEETFVLNGMNLLETEARCICHGHFTGPRCEAKLILTPDVIKAHYIGFKVSFHNVSSGEVISSDSFQDSLSYSIQYWKNSSERSCSIATNIYSPIDGLDGLQMDTSFTLCAVTDPAGWCVPREVNLTYDKNCLVIKTLNTEYSFWSQSFILPVAISVIVVLCLSILVILCMIKRIFMPSDNHQKSRQSQTDWAKKRRREKQREQSKEVNLVKVSSLDDLLTDSYPSPEDSSIDRRTTRKAGTTTFAPVFNQSSLPNVMEEHTTEDILLNQNESSHMLHHTNGSVSEA